MRSNEGGVAARRRGCASGRGRDAVPAAGSGGLGRGDVRQELARRGLEGDGAGVGVDVEAGHRLHPVGALAPAVDAVGTDLGQVGVPPGGEGVDQLADLGRLGGVVLGGTVVDPDGLPREVGVDVGVLVAGAEPLGPLPFDLDDLVGEVAGPVLGAGVALAEREAAPVGGHDVGHAVGGAADGGLEVAVGDGRSPGRRGALGPAGAAQQDQGGHHCGQDRPRAIDPNGIPLDRSDRVCHANRRPDQEQAGGGRG